LQQATLEIEKLNQLLQADKTTSSSLKEQVQSLEEKENLLARFVSELESKLTVSENDAESKDSKHQKQVDELQEKISSVSECL
jgi:uncharacterized protein YlxP (DUF503 family)